MLPLEDNLVGFDVVGKNEDMSQKMSPRFLLTVIILVYGRGHDDELERAVCVY